jgi:dephospho-CoA kinase
MSCPLVIGVTGGVGAGKSTACAAFARLGTPIVDADECARALVALGQPALAEIVALFGADCLRPDGTLDRPALRRRIFPDPAARQSLEGILHPRIRAACVARIAVTAGPYLLLCLPLLVECLADYRPLLQRILVVDCPPAVQISRVAARDRLTGEEVEAMICAQIGREDRLCAADDVIDNGGPLPDLERQVLALHRRYLALAPAFGEPNHPVRPSSTPRDGVPDDRP